MMLTLLFMRATMRYSTVDHLTYAYMPVLAAWHLMFPQAFDDSEIALNLAIEVMHAPENACLSNSTLGYTLACVSHHIVVTTMRRHHCTVHGAKTQDERDSLPGLLCHTWTPG